MFYVLLIAATECCGHWKYFIRWGVSNVNTKLDIFIENKKVIFSCKSKRWVGEVTPTGSGVRAAVWGDFL